MGFVNMPLEPENTSDDPFEDDWQPADDEAPDAPPADHGSAPKTPSPFAEKWVKLADFPDWLTQDPPAQSWLLTQWRDGRDQGVFPRGRTGLVNATGGVGKTYLLTQLAIAVGGGGFWLETFRVAEPGNVCLALAEEDADEARRRIWRAANAMDLSADERRIIAERIHVLPLAGVSVALTCSPTRGVIVATEAATELRKELEARGVNWALVILDPLSRWAGGGVEADNEAATRFCQVVETFTTVVGNPSVLIAHHSSKVSAKDGAADARGVSGIRDGFRWQATLDPLRSEAGKRGAILRNRKSNYSLEFDDLVLVRSSELGTEGTLRPASKVDLEDFGLGGSKVVDETEERLLRTLRSMGTAKSKREIVEKTTGEDRKLYAALKDLLVSGRIKRDEHGQFYAAAQQGAAEGVRDP